MTTSGLTVADFRNLMDLRACVTAPDLRAAWLALSPLERAVLRWNPQLAVHARAVLDHARSTAA